MPYQPQVYSSLAMARGVPLSYRFRFCFSAVALAISLLGCSSKTCVSVPYAQPVSAPAVALSFPVPGSSGVAVSMSVLVFPTDANPPAPLSSIHLSIRAAGGIAVAISSITQSVAVGAPDLSGKVAYIATLPQPLIPNTPYTVLIRAHSPGLEIACIGPSDSDVPLGTFTTGGS